MEIHAANVMKPFLRHPIFRAAACTAALFCSIPLTHAAFVLSDATGFFETSFRGEANTTYFGWSNGTIGVGGNTINGTPAINPDNLSGSSFLVQAGSNDIVSGSNNLYTSVNAVNTAQLTLNIPTSGVVGIAGFTTIIIQGYGFGGFGFPLDAFAFGDIEGIAPTYEYGATAVEMNRGQWWAKWEIPGNAASYSVDITGHDAGAGVLSVTDMIVDTQYSTTGYAADSATLVPEPSVMLTLSAAGGALLLRRRRA